MRACWGRSTSCIIYDFMIQVISEKHCAAMVLPAIWEIFLPENDRNYKSCSFSKPTFILFLFFLWSQKQESSFQQVAGLITRNISGFCLWPVALYFKNMPNLIDFYKTIFLHVIPVCVIVPCIKGTKAIVI